MKYKIINLVINLAFETRRSIFAFFVRDYGKQSEIMRTDVIKVPLNK